MLYFNILESMAAVCQFLNSKDGSECINGVMCPFRHIRGDRTIVCKHWLRGLCKKGDQCEFLHEFDMKKMPECYFYSRFNACHNKECPFLHIDPESKIKDCPWYDRGFCRHGPHCRHRHVRRVLCMNYLAGFCPNGWDCKHMHPRFELPPSAELKDQPFAKKMPICHFCGEVGHKASMCKKNSDSVLESGKSLNRHHHHHSSQSSPHSQHPQYHHSQQSPSSTLLPSLTTSVTSTTMTNSVLPTMATLTSSAPIAFTSSSTRGGGLPPHGHHHRPTHHTYHPGQHQKSNSAYPTVNSNTGGHIPNRRRMNNADNPHSGLYSGRMAESITNSTGNPNVSSVCDNSTENESVGGTTKTPKSLDEITCYKCGNKGHYANKCPKGHLAFLSNQKSHK